MNKKTPLRSIIILFGILFLLVLTPRWIQASDPETAELQAVWQRVREAGAYEFTADLTQTAAPLPTVKNAGREDKVTQLYMEGNSNLTDESLMLTVWSGGGSALAPETGQQVKVENGEAFARQGNGPWESIDDFSDMFAPGGDFMTFLVAAENVTRGSWERQETPAGKVTFLRYTFEINGRLFAEFMREQLTEQLNAKGELPPGMSLDVPKAYVGMTGQGEVWVSEDGLPIRQILDIQFPETADDYSISAHVAVDFSAFPPLPAPTLANKINRVLRPAIAGMTTLEGISPIFVLLMMIGLTIMMVRRR
ncbi:MAG: hypothetical protein WAM60_25945, partial [Candidatus Promineifilaceae bacterium]